MNDLDEASAQEQMIREQIIERGIHDPRVLDAMRSVPRDRFFPRDSANAPFADQAAPIGHGQTISQPYMVALMTAKLDVQPTHKVLELGTGSGYQTAILAKLACEVYTVERVKPLLDEAWERLMAMGIRNAHFRHGDGTMGWPQAAPFDRILITAGAPAVPRDLLLSQLCDGGLAILPVGNNDQMLVAVVRHGNDLVKTDICPCRFVKLIGKEGWRENG